MKQPRIIPCQGLNMEGLPDVTYLADVDINTCEMVIIQQRMSVAPTWNDGGYLLTTDKGKKFFISQVLVDRMNAEGLKHG